MSSEPDCPIPGFSSVAHFSSEGLKRVVAATKAFQSLPSAGPAWDLHKSYPLFNRAMKNARNKLVPMITSLLKHSNMPLDEFKFADIDEKFDLLVEANDDMLERIGLALDEASGLFKKAETLTVHAGTATAALRPPGTWGKRKAVEEQSGPFPARSKKMDEDEEPTQSNREIKRAIYKRTVKEKPQIRFKTPVDNSTGPFIPKLKEKPNSIKPLSILPEYNAKNEEFYGHPYFVELNRWEPRDSMLTKVVAKPPKELEDTTLVEVNTVRDIEQLLRDLYPVSELAVDLEHHGYRSFLGFTCLLQISTREKDYIIDTLLLREHLYHLNEIFTNPKIIKVLHGSTSDIEWLQKDFGLYIVNMFDTQIAAKLLSFPQLGLQALLDKYCGVTQNKTFQLADWRIRPLSKEMKHYARQDTHSLLYIYDMLRNELIDAGNEHNNLLLSAYDQSKMMCLKRYEKPGNNPKLALRKMRRSLNNRQVYAFMELYKWRDGIAREKDESVAYVLPNHMLLMISEQLPKEMTGILACCDPVPPLVQSSLGIIHKIITTARQLPLQENTHEEKSEKRQKLKDWVILMNSVHDVNLNEIKDMGHKSEINEENSPDDAMDEDQNPELSQDVLEWPQPLREPNSSFVQDIASRPSIFFNNKIRPLKRRAKSITQEPNDMDAAATPFERYQLSKEIMEILKDPQKKAALDMENPVVKAIYETVFFDPSEFEHKTAEERPQVLEKVFTEGEFIPFNPLVGSAKHTKKRKRNDDWDDSVQILEDNSAPQSKALKIQVVDLEDDNDNDEVDQAGSASNLEPFMSVSNNASAKKSKKKKAKGNILNKLKNSFKKKKGNQSAPNSSRTTRDVKTQSPKPHRNNKNDNSGNSGGSSGGKRQSPRNKQDKDDRSRGKKSGKFFDFRNRGSGGRSMTFK